MKIAMIQMETKAYAYEDNVKRGFLLLEEAAEQASLLVLPELWTVGYGFRNLEENAVTMESELVKRLQAFAEEKSVYLLPGSLPYKEGGKIYNRSFLFSPHSGITATYDKLHIFSLLNEPHYFSGGFERKVAGVDEVCVGLSICYDLRFPELYRALTMDGARLILVPAQWPEARESAWLALNQARAMENQVYICAVNGVGEYKGNVFCGNSLFISPDGEVLARGGRNEEIVYVEYSEKILETVRSRMAVWADRRPEAY